MTEVLAPDITFVGSDHRHVKKDTRYHRDDYDHCSRFFQKEAWLDAIKAGGLFSVLFSMLLIAADVFFPIVPFALVAALNGAVFGIANGIWITLTGSMLGTMMLFFLARYSFRDWASKKVQAYPAIQSYEASFHKNAFAAVLLGRLIPVIPSLVMNVICGLSQVRWHVFSSRLS